MKIVTFVEYLLLTYILFFFVTAFLPFDQLFDYTKEIREAKKSNMFYQAEEGNQIYFDRMLKSKGLIYNSSTNEASIIVSSQNLFYHHVPNLPSLRIVTKDGETEVITTGGGSTSSFLMTTGHYNFENLPKDIESMELFSSRFGESFSFTYKVGDQDE